MLDSLDEGAGCQDSSREQGNFHSEGLSGTLRTPTGKEMASSFPPFYFLPSSVDSFIYSVIKPLPNTYLRLGRHQTIPWGKRMTRHGICPQEDHSFLEKTEISREGQALIEVCTRCFRVTKRKLASSPWGHRSSTKMVTVG